jgi:hypothetical protein
MLVAFAANLLCMLITLRGGGRMVVYVVVICGGWCALGVAVLALTLYVRSRSVNNRARALGRSVIAGAAYGGIVPLVWLGMQLYSFSRLADPVMAISSALAGFTVAKWLTPAKSL